MKKLFLTILFVISVLTLCFAGNPLSDFYYDLDDNGLLVITGIKKKKSDKQDGNALPHIEIASQYEGITVNEVRIADCKDRYGIYCRIYDCELKLPESLRILDIDAFGLSLVRIVNLPKSLVTCKLRKQDFNGMTPIEILDSIGNAVNLKNVSLENVKTGSNTFVFKKTWNTEDCTFVLPDVTELVIEEGCQSVATFSYCNNLKKVKLPSTIKLISDKAFTKCELLSEIIIPETILSIRFNINEQNFYETNLSLSTKSRLRKLGYRGKFGTE